MSLVSLLFSFKGRINRAQYWLIATVSTFAYFVLSMLSGGFAAPMGKGAGLSGPALLMLGLLMLAAAIIGVAAQVKRFHDRGRSGWFVLAPLAPLFMIVSEVVNALANQTPPLQVLSSMLLWFCVLGAIHIWFFIDLGCLPGQSDVNKYGPPPGSGGLPAPTAPRTPAPGAPIPGMSAPPAAAPASDLNSAQAAIDRAIAEQRARGAVPQAQAPLRAAPAGGAPSFGRRVR